MRSNESPRLRKCVLGAAALGLLAACGDTPPADPVSEPEAPTIGTDMQRPVDDPFCYFFAEGSDTSQSGEDANYVFVTAMGDSVYHGYAKLEGEVRQLTEIEAGFGAGMETRRYVTEDDSVELEVILLDEQEGATASTYTGSVRVIYPVEGDAVKFYGECRYQGESE